MIECPLKPEFMCGASAALIHESRCLSCPNIGCEILNNPYDGFGSKVGYRPDDYDIIAVDELSYLPAPLCFTVGKAKSKKSYLPPRPRPPYDFHPRGADILTTRREYHGEA